MRQLYGGTSVLSDVNTRQCEGFPPSLSIPFGRLRRLFGPENPWEKHICERSEIHRLGPLDVRHQRIYKTKKPRQRTRRPKTGPCSEVNAAILVNITLDPHEENTSGEIYYVLGGRKEENTSGGIYYVRG